MKSIKTKLLVFFSILIGAICIGFSIVSFINAKMALKSNVEMTLPEIATQTANNIQGRIEGELKALETLAARDDIRDLNNSIENKMAVLTEEVNRSERISMAIIDKEGNATVTTGATFNASDRKFFIDAMAGKSSISDPVVSKDDGKLSVMYAVPIKVNDTVESVLIGVRDGNNLSELTNEVKVGETGTVFIINSNGVTIADADINNVYNMFNIIEESKKDESLKLLADINRKMINKEKGTGNYIYDGVMKYVGYAPIEGTEWSLGIAVSENEILSQLSLLKITTIGFSVIFILIGCALVYAIAVPMAKEIFLASKHLEVLASGNLSKEVPEQYLRGKDEIGAIANSMKVMQESLKAMITKIKENSLNINGQSGNLASIAEEISKVSQNVTESISEVASGTENQSENLLKITKIVDEFSSELSSMVEEIQVVDANSREIVTMANASGAEMEELNVSVENVSNSFKEFYDKIMSLGKDISEINEITSLINSVAEQTNLLALNAAIEAARAGEAGKGFAVVAEEIRQLAEQSKDSSENINKLIYVISENAQVIVEESIKMDDEMNNQAKIIDNSITSFKKIISAVDEVIPKIEGIRHSADKIEDDKDSILNSINGASSISLEVSASTQEISAAAEEMNASTEEVASSAQILANMTEEMLEEVNKFKL